jgi:hypothetical protein
MTPVLKITTGGDLHIDSCAPSQALQVGNRPDNLFPQFQTFKVLSSLKQGYYVLVADDNGPRAACSKHSSSIGTRYAVNVVSSGRAATGLFHFRSKYSRPLLTLALAF